MGFTNFRDLIVWQKAMDLVIEIYSLTRSFPKSEIFGLSSQMQKAAVSVPSNIAEGHGRESTKSYIFHLSISKGSLQELETQLIIATRLKYIQRDETIEAGALIIEIDKMLNSLVRKLKLKLKRNAEMEHSLPLDP